jgi:hypothetical protein
MSFCIRRKKDRFGRLTFSKNNLEGDREVLAPDAVPSAPILSFSGGSGSERNSDMRQFRNALAALVIGSCAPGALIAPAFAQTCACPPSGVGPASTYAPSGGGYYIQADEPPPPLPEYNQPPISAPGYYWTPGYWAWNNYDYYWVPGVWVEPPQPGLLWTPGFWAFTAGVFAFTPGYWGPHVGFYGGINYGFGYVGSGYQGGRWDNGRFFYNTAVNNIGGAHITNVYNQQIVNNTTINNTSFNGGPGGVVAKPTNAELVAAKEPRVQATALQVNQARAAGMRSEQFVSTNRGKPAIAATARPGEFKGKGVVPATAAGKAALATPAAPAPNATVLPETKEKLPIGEKPAQPGLPPNAPKLGEKPPAAEKLAAPEAAPPAPKVEPKPPAVEKLAKPEAAPPAPKPEPKPPAPEKLAKPEAAPPPPKPEPKPPAPEKLAKPEAAPPAPKPPVVEHPARPAPPPAAQRAPERPPAPAERRPAQPEHKPEAKECGRPGLPPCPR